MNAVWRNVALATRFGLVVIAVTTLALRAQVDPPAPTFSNVTVHDPSIIREGSTFYVFGSHMASASSTDLINWTQITTGPTYPNSLIRNQNPQTEFAAALAYAGGTNTFWAPDVIKLGDGRFYFYYCACQGTSPLSALGLAVANSITGPYADVGILLRSAGSNPTVPSYNVNTMPNVVDPSVFYDNTGKLWMVYGSFSGGLFILALDPATGQPVAGQGYGKKLIGGNSSRIEGPYIIYNPATSFYYLFCTFGGLDAAGGYNIRVGRSLQPDGPYLDAAGNDLTNVKGNFAFDDATIAPYGVKLMGNYQFLHVAGEPGSTSRGYVSPGGTSVYRDPATGKYFLVFHTRFVGRGEQHEVRVHQLYFNPDGWPVVAPQRYAGETMAPTDVGRIVGNYKLINHNKAITTTVSTSSAVSLLADGTVSGAATGTWQLSGTNDVTFVLAGITYRGVFARQWDDDTQVWVLDFTALSNNGVALWGSKVAINTAPAILTDPVGQTVFTGANVTLSTVASGDPAPSYQWKKNNVAISGATGSSYVIASVGTGDAGSYTVVATNSMSSATSTAAALTVNVAAVAPVITANPANQTVLSGATASFSAAASGTPAPTYQWQRLPVGSAIWANLSNGGNYANVTAATLSVTNTADAMNGDQFRCVATNSVDTATSTSATLTVNALPPLITTQPQSRIVLAGSSVSFSVIASSAVPLTYQWKKDSVDLAGATSSTYTITDVQAAAVGSYTVVVGNSGGSITSVGAALSLGTIPAGFDVNAYLTRYPAVAAVYGTDLFGAWIYYRDQGVYDGEVFDELFRVEEYLTLYPELFTVFGDDLTGALLHWLTQGSIEGRLGRVPLEFSATGYLSRNPDVAAAVNNDALLAWSHYWLYGIYEGRFYDDELRVFEYLAVNADLTAAFVNDWRAAALHWMRYGRTEGRLGRLPLIFNVTEYLTRSPDVAAAWGTHPTTVFLHYWGYGIDESRTFDDEFRPAEYLALNADLAAVFGTDLRGAFKHWVRYGRAEGRPGRNP